VIKMVASGRSVIEVSQALGIGENVIYRWKKQQRDASVDRIKGKKEVDVWQEVDQLRERLRQTEMERDVLKKLWPFSAA
jgi:transposase